MWKKGADVMTKYPELPVNKLRFTCDENLFHFENYSEYISS